MSYLLKARPNEVIKRILRFYCLDRKAFFSERKYTEYVRGRDAFVWIARTNLKLSYPRIGRAINRHHTTVMASFRRAKALYENDPAFKTEIAFITAMVNTNGDGLEIMQ